MRFYLRCKGKQNLILDSMSRQYLFINLKITGLFGMKRH